MVVGAAALSVIASQPFGLIPDSAQATSLAGTIAAVGGGLPPVPIFQAGSFVVAASCSPSRAPTRPSPPVRTRCCCRLWGPSCSPASSPTTRCEPRPARRTPTTWPSGPLRRGCASPRGSDLVGVEPGGDVRCDRCREQGFCSATHRSRRCDGGSPGLGQSRLRADSWRQGWLLQRPDRCAERLDTMGCLPRRRRRPPDPRDRRSHRQPPAQAGDPVGCGGPAAQSLAGFHPRTAHRSKTSRVLSALGVRPYLEPARDALLAPGRRPVPGGGGLVPARHSQVAEARQATVPQPGEAPRRM